jgi:hypothetical protein
MDRAGQDLAGETLTGEYFAAAVVFLASVFCSWRPKSRRLELAVHSAFHDHRVHRLC